jgi:hypothetical protein
MKIKNILLFLLRLPVEMIIGALLMFAIMFILVWLPAIGLWQIFHISLPNSIDISSITGVTAYIGATLFPLYWEKLRFIKIKH